MKASEAIGDEGIYMITYVTSAEHTVAGSRAYADHVYHSVHTRRWPGKKPSSWSLALGDVSEVFDQVLCRGPAATSRDGQAHKLLGATSLAPSLRSFPSPDHFVFRVLLGVRQRCQAALYHGQSDGAGRVRDTRGAWERSQGVSGFVEAQPRTGPQVLVDSTRRLGP